MGKYVANFSNELLCLKPKYSPWSRPRQPMRDGIDSFWALHVSNCPR